MGTITSEGGGVVSTKPCRRGKIGMQSNEEERHKMGFFFFFKILVIPNEIFDSITD